MHGQRTDSGRIDRPASRRRGSRRARSEATWAYLLIAPMMIGFTVFFVIALGASFFLGFTQWRIIETPIWIGLGNYRELAHDPKFREALVNTFAITVPEGGAPADFLDGIRGRPELPHPVPRVLSSAFLFARGDHAGRDRDDLEVALRPSVRPHQCDSAPVWSAAARVADPPGRAIVAVVIVLLWSGIGYDMIIYLAGLQAIPRLYYEAASLDGAGGWQQFRGITLPLLTPTIFFLSVIGIIYSLQVFDLVYVMTRIDQTNRLPTVVYFIYNEGFRNFRMGYAIAIAWTLLAIILVFTIVQFRLQKRWVNYE